jgi:hypothetical protein
LFENCPRTHCSSVLFQHCWGPQVKYLCGFRQKAKCSKDL